MAYVRKCEKCGNVDTRERWESPSHAASQDAFTKWACPSCAWTEFDLIEDELIEDEAPTEPQPTGR